MHASGSRTHVHVNVKFGITHALDAKKKSRDPHKQTIHIGLFFEVLFFSTDATHACVMCRGRDVWR